MLHEFKPSSMSVILQTHTEELPLDHSEGLDSNNYTPNLQSPVHKNAQVTNIIEKKQHRNSSAKRASRGHSAEHSSKKHSSSIKVRPKPRKMS